jgi:predicted DNA-binding protein
MGRKLTHPERLLARLSAGTKERIDAALGEDEGQADLVREAIERELKRRERARK